MSSFSGAVPPFAVQAGEGRTLPTPTDDQVTVKADTRQTNGSMTVLEFVFGPDQGPARHMHLREDELWYVLEGEFRFSTGDVMLYASTGGLAFGPRGLPHTFQNIGEAPGRLLVITTPSGLERFFEQTAQMALRSVDPDELAAVGTANWLDFVGPPLNVSDPR
jgi:mannose-6-phosphate isomerase-like protein (cupin superfamily)